MNTEGAALKKAVKLSDLTAEQIAMKAGISRTQLYRMFEWDVIDDYSKLCLKKAGIDMDKLLQTSKIKDQKQTPDEQSEKNSSSYILKAKYDLLLQSSTEARDKLIQLQKEIISNLERENAALKELLAVKNKKHEKAP